MKIPYLCFCVCCFGLIQGAIPSSLLAQTRSDTSVASVEKEFELVILNGRIVDGSGAPWYRSDIGIRKGKIVRVGKIDAKESHKSIDAEGLVVAPGFIDMMGQSATPMATDPKTAMNLLTQGITTINAGEGVSASPLRSSEWKENGWTSMREYLALLDMQGLPINVAQSVGHTQIRRIVLGDVDRRPGPEELLQMQQYVREAMQSGAIGLSTALIYPPATYAQTEEIAALAKVAGEFGGKYFTHMRNESDHLLEAIDEALEIGRLGKTPVHIFHLKTAGEQNWGKMQLAIGKIQASRKSGQSVTADIYPYINNGLEISAFVHPKHFVAGRESFLRSLLDANVRAQIRKEMEDSEGWENWFRNVRFDWERVVIGQTNEKRYADQVGTSVAAIAKFHKEDPWDTFFALVRAGAFALPQSMSEANKILAMQQDFVSFCTDVGPDNGNLSASHPRAYGAFPRIFARYVRELGAISLERAIAQSTSVAANELFAFDRGRIAPGLAADIVVFDEQSIADRATFAQPKEPAQGVRFVVVNGELVLEDGKYTGNRPGRVLRGPGYSRSMIPSSQMTGKPVKEFAKFEQSIQSFLDTHAIPGAAIAVAHDGTLLYERGFGFSDLATGDLVQPNSLFRIASISKPVTAVAVLQLVERGKLQLDHPVLEYLQLDGAIERAGDAFDPRFRKITIRYLLQHRGGWDRDKSFDAMFQSVRFAEQFQVPPPAGPKTVIDAMLRQKLDFDPGEKYAYSNFGYCLLGRAIESVTGMAYDRYVQENVLQPIGIHSMKIGSTRLEDRSANEVRYYSPGVTSSVFQSDLGQQTPWPYGGWYLEAMDAHGGWIASAGDLVRFANALNSPSKLLNDASLAALRERPDGNAGLDESGQPKDVYYGLGWFTRSLKKGGYNQWHTGSLSGTATILIRLHNGWNVVALFNSRTSPTTEHLGRAADTMLVEALKQVDLDSLTK